MSNREQLRELLMDIFLLEDDEFSFELKKDEVETWDSLGTVSMAVTTVPPEMSVFISGPLV